MPVPATISASTSSCSPPAPARAISRMRGSGDFRARPPYIAGSARENDMSLSVAVQMDPLDAINIAGDSTFALMLSAQARGHRLFHYAPEDLNYCDGRVWTRAHPVTVQRVQGDHFSFGEPVSLDLGDEADVVLMRQDPPFDLGYITATHLLERIAHPTLGVNDPAR